MAGGWGMNAAPETSAISRAPLRRLARLVLLLTGNLALLAFVLFWAIRGPELQRAWPVVAVEVVTMDTKQGPPQPDLRGLAASFPLKLPPLDFAASPERWLRLRVQAPDTVGQGMAIFFPYLEPGASVWLNGVWLRNARGLETGLRSNWSVPDYLALPATLLVPGENLIDIRLRPANGGAIDVGRPIVAPDEDLRPFFKHGLRIQSMGIQIINLLVGLMGAVNLLIGWGRRSEAVYRLFGLTCFLSILRNLEYFYPGPPMPVGWYLVGCELAKVWLAAVTVHTCEIILDRSRRLTAPGYGLAMISSLVIPFTGVGLFSGFVDFLVLLLNLALAVILTIEAWRRQQLTYELLWCAVFVTTGGAVYEFLHDAGWIRGDDYNLVPYGWLLFARAICWLLIEGFIRTLDRREALNRQLKDRVEAFGRELESQYGRTTALERRNAAIEERERILRDMHDGLGFHLVSAIAEVASRPLSQQELVTVFSSALTELRNALNATANVEGNLFQALAALRTRVEPGLQQASVQVTWMLQEADGLESLGADAVQNVIAIVQEALSNAIRHSQASEVNVEAGVDPALGCQVRVVDNGTGIRNDGGRRGEGLATMRWRAEKIGAAFDILSRPGRTEVRLSLPAPAASRPGAACERPVAMVETVLSGLELPAGATR